MREDVIRLVDEYLHGLAAQDISAALFRFDVEFEGPLGPMLEGMNRMES